MKHLLNWIKSLVPNTSYQYQLDKFVTSKRPTNTAEVEFWVNYFEKNPEVRI